MHENKATTFKFTDDLANCRDYRPTVSLKTPTAACQPAALRFNRLFSACFVTRQINSNVNSNKVTTLADGVFDELDSLREL